MKQRFLLFWLLSSMGGSTFGAEATASEIPPQHFLFVADTSFSMAPEKETLSHAAYDLIYSGVGGEMNQGDVFGFWTFNENPETRQFPAKKWNPEQRQALANQVYTFLRDQPFQKISRFDKALDEILRSGQDLAKATIVILSDGLEFVRGTPFNAELNTVYRERSAELQREKKPFITVLQLKNGEIIGWSICAVGERVRIPRSASATQTNLVEEAKASPGGRLASPEEKTIVPGPSGRAATPLRLTQITSAAPVQLPLPTTPAPVSLAAEQDPSSPLVETAKEAAKASIVLALTKASEVPVPLPETKKAEVLTAQGGGTEVPFPGIKAAQDTISKREPVPSTRQEIPQSPVTTSETIAPVRPVTFVNVSNSLSTSAPPVESQSPVGQFSSPNYQLATNDSEPAKAAPEASSLSGTAVAQTDLSVSAGASQKPRRYLVLGLGSFMVAVALLYFLLRKPRSAQRSSLISRSTVGTLK